MKKTILAVVLILLLAGTGTPFISGLMMERTLKEVFNDINQMYSDTGSDISIEISRYDRNYSSSLIEWKIKLGTLKAFYGVDELIFLDRAKHGFTSVVSYTSLEKNKWFIDFVNQKLNGENPFKIRTEYNYSGVIEALITLEGFILKDENEVYKFMPGQIATTFDKGMKNVFTEGIWEGFSVSDKFKIDEISVNSKLEKFSTIIWAGDTTLATKKIKGKNAKNQFELSNVKCDYSIDVEKTGNALSFRMGYGIDSIVVDQNQIKDASIQIGINRINIEGYREFIKIGSQVMKNAMDDMPEVFPQDNEEAKKAAEKRMASLGFQMIPVYEKLLKQGLEIQISDLKAQLSQGQIKGDITLGLRKDMTLAQFFPIMIQPGLALDIFSLKSDASLPYELIADKKNLLHPIFPGMQTGLFVKKGNNLIHSAETRNGKLLLNGQEVELE